MNEKSENFFLVFLFEDGASLWDSSHKQLVASLGCDCVQFISSFENFLRYLEERRLDRCVGVAVVLSRGQMPNDQDIIREVRNRLLPGLPLRVL